MVAVLLLPATALMAASADGGEVRILLIGNSYTAGTRRAFDQLIRLRKGVVASYITPGGCTLEKHLANSETTETVRTGRWEFVVLQEQSQMPSLPGEFGQSFQDSVDAFARLVKEAGARPVLYLTWGRRDGDAKNERIHPDYLTMQNRLTEAYLAAGDRNGLLIAPVGEAWRQVREADAALGRELYRKDGSHPSEKGAYLAACVLYAAVFGEDATALPAGKGGEAGEAALLRNCAQAAVVAERERVRRGR